jgi:hypothetical protein
MSLFAIDVSVCRFNLLRLTALLLILVGCTSPFYTQSQTQPYVLRDTPGRMARSTAAINAFKREQPCPATHLPTGPCPGYIIDHVIALKRGGADNPANMQWQTVEEAKAKDRVE